MLFSRLPASALSSFRYHTCNHNNGLWSEYPGVTTLVKKTKTFNSSISHFQVSAPNSIFGTPPQQNMMSWHILTGDSVCWYHTGQTAYHSSMTKELDSDPALHSFLISYLTLILHESCSIGHLSKLPQAKEFPADLKKTRARFATYNRFL